MIDLSGIPGGQQTHRSLSRSDKIKTKRSTPFTQVKLNRKKKKQVKAKKTGNIWATSCLINATAHSIVVFVCERVVIVPFVGGRLKHARGVMQMRVGFGSNLS